MSNVKQRFALSFLQFLAEFIISVVPGQVGGNNKLMTEFWSKNVTEIINMKKEINMNVNILFWVNFQRIHFTLRLKLGY